MMELSSNSNFQPSYTLRIHPNKLSVFCCCHFEGYVTLNVCRNIVNRRPIAAARLASQAQLPNAQQYQQSFNMSSIATDAPIEKAITQALTENLSPLHLEVINESYMHNVPKGSETHFKVFVVSSRFESLPLIKVNICCHTNFSINCRSGVTCWIRSFFCSLSDIDSSMILFVINLRAISCMPYQSKPRARLNGTSVTRSNRARVAAVVSASSQILCGAHKRTHFTCWIAYWFVEWKTNSNMYTLTTYKHVLF